MIAKVGREDAILTIPDVDSLICDDDKNLTLISGGNVIGIFLEGEWSCVWLEEPRFNNDVTAVIPKIKADDSHTYYK
jgi:hypothetical protein